jgi:dephospho-CoA kinase
LEVVALKIIGVTGGIGSGKSTVSRILEDLGAVILDADKISQEVMLPEGEAFEEVINYFGKEYLDENNQLDRKKLAQLVFNNPNKLEILNKISHKHIVNRILQGIEQKTIEGYGGVIVIDAPIPLEHGFLDIVDEVWVVDADKDIRVNRVIKRSNMTYEEALKRVNSQLKQSDYLAIADEVIDNNGSIEDLEQNVVKLFLHKNLR